jgi:4-hydroxy-L-threonine phosphate dehydrogenase PdxA
MTECPVIAVSMGDPGGVGPEVIAKALADTQRRASARFVIHGSGAAMNEAARVCGIDPFWWRVSSQSDLMENLDAAAPARSVVLIDDDDWAAERSKDWNSAADIRFMRRPTKLGGTLSFRWVEAAIAATKRDKRSAGDSVGAPFRGLRADAIVTGPDQQAGVGAGRASGRPRAHGAAGAGAGVRSGAR